MTTVMQNEAEMPSLAEASAYSTSDVNRIYLGYEEGGKRYMPCSYTIGLLFAISFELSV